MPKNQTDLVAGVLGATIDTDLFWKIFETRLQEIVAKEKLTFWDKFKEFWRELALAISQIPAVVAIVASGIKTILTGDFLFNVITHKKVLDSLEKRADTLGKILKNHLDFSPELANRFIAVLKDETLQNTIKDEVVALIDGVIQNKSKEALTQLAQNLALKIITVADRESAQALVEEAVHTLDTMVKNGQAQKMITDALPHIDDPKSAKAQENLVNIVAPHIPALVGKGAEMLQDADARNAVVEIAHGLTSENTEAKPDVLLKAAELIVSDAAEPLRQKVVEILKDEGVVENIQALIPVYLPDLPKPQLDLAVAVTDHLPELAEAANEFIIDHDTQDAVIQVAKAITTADSADQSKAMIDLAGVALQNKGLPDLLETFAETLKDQKVMDAAIAAVPEMILPAPEEETNKAKGQREATQELVVAALPHMPALIAGVAKAVESEKIKEKLADAVEDLKSDAPDMQSVMLQAAAIVISPEFSNTREAVVELLQDESLIATATVAIPNILFPAPKEETHEQLEQRGKTQELIKAAIPHATEIAIEAIKALEDQNTQDKIADVIKDLRNETPDMQDVTLKALEIFASPSMEAVRDKIAETIQDTNVISAATALLPTVIETITAENEHKPTESEVKHLQEATVAILETELPAAMIQDQDHLPKIIEELVKGAELPVIALDALEMLEENAKAKKIIESNPEIITNVAMAATTAIFPDLAEDFDLNPELLKILNVVLQDITLSKELVEGLARNDKGLLFQSVSKLFFSDEKISKEMRQFISQPDFADQLSAVIAKISLDLTGKELIQLITSVCSKDSYDKFMASYKEKEDIIAKLEKSVSKELGNPEKDKRLYQYLTKHLGDLTKILSAENAASQRKAQLEGKKPETTLDVKEILRRCPPKVLREVIEKSPLQDKESLKGKIDLFETEKSKAKKQVKEKLKSVLKPAVNTLETHSKTLEAILEPIIKIEKENTEIKKKWLQSLIEDPETKLLISTRLKINRESITPETLLLHVDEIQGFLPNDPLRPKLELKYLNKTEQFELLKKILNYLRDNKELTSQIDSIISGLNVDTITLKSIKEIYKRIGGLQNIDHLADGVEQLTPLVEAAFGTMSWSQAAIAIPVEVAKLGVKAVKTGVDTVYTQVADIAKGSMNYITGNTQSKAEEAEKAEGEAISSKKLIELSKNLTNKICQELFQTEALESTNSRHKDRLLIQDHITKCLNELRLKHGNQIFTRLKDLDSIVGHKNDRKSKWLGAENTDNLANFYYENATEYTSFGILSGGIQIKESALKEKSLSDKIVKYLGSIIEQEVESSQKKSFAKQVKAERGMHDTKDKSHAARIQAEQSQLRTKDTKGRK